MIEGEDRLQEKRPKLVGMMRGDVTRRFGSGLVECEEAYRCL